MTIISNLSTRLLCRIFGHRWQFLHEREAGGKVYLCRRCRHEAAFIR
ncbi:MAG: hypothetical protein IV108_08780 [Burkholderiales bacterium]|nr:hypothetical protein [Burkholderiales bacterium]